MRGQGGAAGASADLSFKSLEIKVVSPFEVMELVPPGGYLAFPNLTKKGQATKMTKAHAKLAAEHARRIAGADVSVKVLVFLTNPEEVREAVSEFQRLCGHKIRCCGIDAKAVGIQQSISQSRVIFSNCIAETSLTIPRLTHVVDFTTALSIHVDREQNSMELKADRCSVHAKLQRRGRLGRTGPGEYCAIYDPKDLKHEEASAASFHKLSNHNLLRCEMRMRHFLRGTLFEGMDPRLTRLGLGLSDKAAICSTLPRDNALIVGAELNMTPAMTAAFTHAISCPPAEECALAILWLCAMLETREPPVPPRTPLPKQFLVGLGLGGDQGILLQIFKSYSLAKKQQGFDLHAWCTQNGNLQPNFLLSAEAQIERLSNCCEILHARGVLQKRPSTFRSPSDWTWDHILEALAHG